MKIYDIVAHYHNALTIKCAVWDSFYIVSFPRGTLLVSSYGVVGVVHPTLGVILTKKYYSSRVTGQLDIYCQQFVQGKYKQVDQGLIDVMAGWIKVV